MNLVLTGSSTGIGRALAGRLLAQSHQVWGLARSDQSDFIVQHPAAFRATGFFRAECVRTGSSVPEFPP